VQASERLYSTTITTHNIIIIIGVVVVVQMSSPQGVALLVVAGGDLVDVISGEISPRAAHRRRRHPVGKSAPRRLPAEYVCTTFQQYAFPVLQTTS